MFCIFLFFKPRTGALEAWPLPLHAPGRPSWKAHPFPEPGRPLWVPACCEPSPADLGRLPGGDVGAAERGGRPSQPPFPSRLDRTFLVLLRIIAADTQRGAPAARWPPSVGLAHTHTHWVAALFDTSRRSPRLAAWAVGGWQVGRGPSGLHPLVQVWPVLWLSPYRPAAL